MKLDVSEEVFWITIWTIASSFILGAILLLSHYSDKENLLVAELIKQGKDPIKLACLYNASNHTEAMCTILISKEGTSD